MPITAQCAGCKKQYRLVDEMAGKKVKCKQCGQTFDVPKSASAPVAATAAAAKAPSKPAAPPAKPTSSAQAPAQARSAPPVRKPIVKSIAPAARAVAAKPPAPAKPVARPQPEPEADPFAAMAELEEGGIPLQDDAPAVAPPPLPPQRASTSPAPAAPRRGTTIGYARPMRGAPDAAAIPESRAMRYLRLWWLFTAGFGLLLFLLSFLAGPLLSIPAFSLMALTGIVLMFWGAIMMLITPFQEDTTCGLLYLFLPFYPLYYLVTRWETMGRHFLRNLGGLVILAVAVLMLFWTMSPSLGRARTTANRVKSAANLRMIGQGLLLHANENAGMYPRTLEELQSSQGLPPSTFNSPLGNAPDGRDYVWAFSDSTDMGEHVAGGLALAYDAAALETGDGTNVLFGDGSVQWLGKPQFDALMVKNNVQATQARKQPKPSPPQRQQPQTIQPNRPAPVSPGR